MNETTYKGFTIEAVPTGSPQDGTWNTKVSIGFYPETGPKGRDFTSLETFPTEKEAIAYCLQFGRDIIDGNVEGCSVRDL